MSYYPTAILKSPVRGNLATCLDLPFLKTGIELEDGVTKQEAASVGQTIKETATTRTINELTFSFFMTMLGFSMTFVIEEAAPLFLITIFTIIAFDLDAAGYTIWILVSQLIAIAAIAPFVGTLSDLFGRKTIVLVSLRLSVLGMIVIGTTPNIAGLLAGQVISGFSIGIQLLTSIAAVTKLVPTSRLRVTIGYIVCGFIPFAPASLYGQYIASHNWRYITVLIGGWAAVAFVVLTIFYRPPPVSNAVGLTNRELLARIDYLGSFLLIVGLVLFLTGLNWGLGCMAAVDPKKINTVWAHLIIGLIGVGGVLLPSQGIFSVIGVSMFHNIFIQQVTKNAYTYFAVPAVQAGIYDTEVEALVSTLGAGPLSHYVRLFPQIDTPEKQASIVLAGHETYKHCFPILYYISIAFGGAAVIASLFLKDLEKYMNDNVAVML
ncbi:hypothetical protein V499_01311 [Pseudogymnoascus sp. VKM F-103]|nr:hypothetical protein V499_01311 [Pseudogymnoascus sp. VKM F-103]